MSESTIAAFLIFLLVSVSPFLLRGVKDPLNVLLPFAAYSFLGIGVRGLALQSGLVPNRFRAPVGVAGLTVSAYMIAAVAICSLFVGYYHRLGPRSLRFINALHRYGTRDANCADSIRMRFAVFCAVMGLGSQLLLFRQLGRPVSIGHDPLALVMELMNGGHYYLTTLMDFPVIGFALAISARGWSRRILAGVLNGVPILLWYSVTGSKALIIEVAIIAVVVVHYRICRLGWPTVLLLAALGFVMTFFLFQFRAYGIETERWQTLHSPFSDAAWQVAEPLIGRSYDYDMLLIIMDRINRDGPGDLRLGQTLSELVYFWIPRQIWPSKPVAFGYSFGSEVLDPSAYFRTSFAPSLIGELYLNWHLLGVIVGYAAIGRVLRIGYLARMAPSPLMTIAYGVFMTRAVHLVEGPMATHFIFAASSLLPLVCLAVYERLTLISGYKSNRFHWLGACRK